MITVKGDVTKNTNGVLLNGVNCQRRMGSGVAKAYYNKWPQVKSQYLKVNPILGNTDFVKINDRLWVANCYTQMYYGYDGRPYASYDAIYSSVVRACEFANERALPVRTPLIGTGLGGLDGEKVVELLEKIETETGSEITLYVL